eukprot:53727-Amphidinium_carterae.1
MVIVADVWLYYSRKKSPLVPQLDCPVLPGIDNASHITHSCAHHPWHSQRMARVRHGFRTLNYKSCANSLLGRLQLISMRQPNS